MDTASFGRDWANDAFVALNNTDVPSTEKWPAFTDSSAFPPPAFTIPPSLLTHGSVSRYGQVTPPEELSPAEPPRDMREQSIPVEQLKNEALFPDHQIQALQNFQPQAQPQEQGDQEQEPSPKRRRTSSRQSVPANQSSPTQSQQDNTQPQPPKRKRGRPKSQPQMVEAYTADGFPLQVSSARQSHLEKNRVAAHKCRQRKKEYIGGLEGRAREYTAKNKALKANVAILREELLELKNEVLRHAGCGFWAVDEYLTRCAGDLLGMQVPAQHRQQQRQSSPKSTTMEPGKLYLDPSEASPYSLGTSNSPDMDDYDGFDLLEDMNEDRVEGQAV
ncbi:hypothetical protein CC80DRAFT_403461 [Byssothecium circinans]|uniref:BZIP domain-containing protein n=1 Tax=Byssothecium circinans TaxID=147558 RepID=A0A6A5U7W7_9PLEO|nr:hypothetical protein CC80DRAFT_403461 [Byssothecium circinans]